MENYTVYTQVPAAEMREKYISMIRCVLQPINGRSLLAPGAGFPVFIDVLLFESHFITQSNHYVINLIWLNCFP